ncbi:cell wall hydrolase [Paroceanicella profunda]|uniref:Cell wall hydrolase n=1 Tax=Paroceanicella profunda TaxID=2579971 RepID=A0A5B8FJ15_9RHOB|nr:cell wall hydrolase [Paroceanicella profunda]
MAQERTALTALNADRLIDLGGSGSPVNGTSRPRGNRLHAEVSALNRADAEASMLVSSAQQRAISAEDRQSILSFSPEEIDLLPVARGGDEFKCLAEALYFEARGESIAGMVAVAEVILNRVESDDFPDTVCKVVNQGTGKLHQCQFSYTCDGRSDRIRNQAAYERVAKVARIMMDGQPRMLTGGATHYHTLRVRPRWTKNLSRTARIGAHVFYRNNA